MKPVYTIGYAGKTPAQIKELAEQLGAVVVDIRFSPFSRNPVWSGKQLRLSLGDRYVHLRAFGNANYKGGPISIVDYAAGKAFLLDMDKPAILMCVCKDPLTCHRTTVAAKLLADGLEVTELDRPASQFVQPELL